MAIFVAHTAIGSVWAEEENVLTTTLSADKTYGNGGETWNKSVWHPDHSKDIYITSDPANTYSITFDGKNEAITESAVSAGSITVESVKSFTLSNVSMTSFYLGAGMWASGSSGKVTYDSNGSDSTTDAIVVSNNSLSVDDGNALGGWMYTGAVEIANTIGHIKVSGNSVSSTWEGSAVNGGAIASEALVDIHHNDDIYYTNNTATGKGNTCGGAICALAPSGTSINVEANGDVVFSGNSATGIYFTVGGAIGALSDVVIKDNNSISFSENKGIATGNSYGGGIYSLGKVQISGNVAADSTADSVDFSGNSLSAANSAFGGAIGATAESVNELMDVSSTGHDVTLENNGNINFSDNSIETVGRGRGGAIYADNHVALADNAGITFAGNNITTKEIGSAVGGAIAANFSQTSQTPIDTSSVSVTGNTGKISFENNTVTAEQWTAHGGAIYSAGQLTLQGNKKEIVFEGNKAIADIASDASGGAIMTVGKTLITENEGNISFADNTVSSQGGNAGGGAIIGFGTGVSITDNIGTVTFSGNKVEGVSGYEAVMQETEVIVGTDKLILGGAIASFSSVDITGNGLVAFSGNTVADSFVESINTTDGDSMEFGENFAITAGGAIGSWGSINLTGNNGLTIENNQVQSNGRISVGGALAAFDTVNISDNTGAVKINDNSLISNGYLPNRLLGHEQYFYAYGGAIYAQNVEMKGNASGVTISGNSLVNGSHAFGGAIAALAGAVLSDNGDVEFSNNGVTSIDDSAYGGAIYTEGDVLLNNNTSLAFNNNYSISGSTDNASSLYNNVARGGAIYSKGNVVLGKTDSLKFSENKVVAHGSTYYMDEVGGGAIYAYRDITIGGEQYGNKDVLFYGNTVLSNGLGVCGGAIATDDSAYVFISHNGAVTFESNSITATGDEAQGAGGAISITGGLYISDNSGTVLFKNNAAVANGGVNGGAIMVSDGSVMIYNNKDVVFEGNQSRTQYRWAVGAAIGVADSVLIGLNDNVTIKNNTSINYNSYDVEISLDIGGAISAVQGDVMFAYNRGDINVVDNCLASQSLEGTQYLYGGAIYANGFSIYNNAGDVTFAGNFESGNNGTFLRSVYVEDGTFVLAAEEGKSISFYDAIYVGEGDSPVYLNAYSDMLDGNKMKISTGDIVFSGIRTEQDLAAAHQYLKEQNFNALTSENDVNNSRTSVIERDVSIAAGSLQVRDGAVLQVKDLSVADDAELLVSSGSRIEAGSIIFDSNTEFTVTGASSSIAYAATFSVREAALVAELQADTVTLTGGMTYTQEGAYTLMVGDSNKLIIDVSNGLAFTLNLDASVAYTEGDMTYFVLFTGVEMPPELVGADSWDQVGVNYNLGGNYTDPTMGYDKATGTLYVSAKSSTIPEPTTATLSLLALAALAARRRRR